MTPTLRALFIGPVTILLLALNVYTQTKLGFLEFKIRVIVVSMAGFLFVPTLWRVNGRLPFCTHTEMSHKFYWRGNGRLPFCTHIIGDSVEKLEMEPNIDCTIRS